MNNVKKQLEDTIDEYNKLEKEEEDSFQLNKAKIFMNIEQEKFNFQKSMSEINETMKNKQSKHYKAIKEENAAFQSKVAQMKQDQ